MTQYEEPTSWSLVVGFAIIGAVLVGHMLWCVRRGRYVARRVSVDRDQEPKTFWTYIALQSLVAIIVVGGLAAYLYKMELT